MVKQLSKLFTGINGFDEVLNGGLPKGRTVLVSGGPGTGKTVLLNEYIHTGIKNFGQPGVFVTFEEVPEYIMTNVKSFGWDYKHYLEKEQLAFVDISPDTDIPNIEIDDLYDLSPITERILSAVKRIGAKRVAIDNIPSFFNRVRNKAVLRDLLFSLIGRLNSSGVTTLLSNEKSDAQGIIRHFGIEEFVADGIIELEINAGEQSFVRNLFIRKLRGSSYRSGKVEFDITGDGLIVFPKIPMSGFDYNTNFDSKLDIDNGAFDKALGGGVPTGHLVLVSGNTGAGKTIFGLQFLSKGLENGENALFVALEESIPQVKKTAANLGWNLGEDIESDRFVFVKDTLIDTRPDKLLYDIIRSCEKYNIKRVVFDSISSIESAAMQPEGVRQFMIQLASYFKSKGITSFCNYLSSTTFGASEGQLLAGLETNTLRLSSIVDGVILLRYVERKSSVEKLFNILKMRGTGHSKSIYLYDIGTGGLKLGEKHG